MHADEAEPGAVEGEARCLEGGQRRGGGGDEGEGRAEALEPVVVPGLGVSW